MDLKKKDDLETNVFFSLDELDELLEDARKKTDGLLMRYQNRFVHTATTHGKYLPIDGFEWTKGFYTGLFWQFYLFSNDEKYRKVALAQCEALKQAALKSHQGIQNHDAGFLYSLSTVAGYAITGLDDLKETSVLAANVLKERFLPQAGIIQAWGKIGEVGINQGRIIIDTLMNLPLLLKVWEWTRDESYKTVALSHLKKALSVLIRPDGTTYHTYYFDPSSGKPLYGKTHQGKSDDSMWARGQAWAIYALPLIYRYLPEEKELILIAKRLLDCFLNALPSDLVCPWDFSCKDDPYAFKDAGTMPIVALGILQMLEYGEFFSKSERAYYEQMVHRILRALLDGDYISFSHATYEDGLVRHCVYAYPDKGINECCLWGDYFYIELLMKLRKKDFMLFW
ncbi:MAG TPA: glycoside hydrolase family 88 protein [Candidatus Pelethenecus faecipullorum]|uniref:Glycoside hydrolase family 88 protein n=1 Tax=Candidatus Pelethenecus faecipullorum TaxID=2840900 RepID=A0A9D1GPJ2_9MOLU|nr:glycoside hydrolase family 88 protein [Candidatus Pelethenecus faecipullorum]